MDEEDEVMRKIILQIKKRDMQNKALKKMLEELEKLRKQEAEKKNNADKK